MLPPSSSIVCGWRRVASEAFLLPSSCAIASAELSAAHRLPPAGVLVILQKTGFIGMCSSYSGREHRPAMTLRKRKNKG
eukprot:4168620-Pyramimonas_sp.AAC.1